MKFIIGKKIDMTQIWQGEEAKAVTRVKAGPCPVVQVKRRDKDGYEAVQLGFGERKEKNIKKPQKNHARGLGNLRNLREFNLSRPKKNDGLELDLKRGDIIGVDTFAAGDIVQVTGTSKGKGFQGVVKRHGFHGHNTTHGTKDQVRHSGSISAGGVQHV
ncbi:50S ribosomal protein L3, partial [Candidatus Falkowbacteria bacterium RIFOXYC2_FULL_46_15]